jgi:membrane protein YdbS with pleckstrin-like domain
MTLGTENETFSNAQLNAITTNENTSASDIPQLYQLNLEAISPRYRVINISLAFGIAFVLIMVASALRYQSFFMLPEPLAIAYPYIIIGICVLGCLWTTYHFFADPLIKFALREQDLSLQSGLVFRSLSCQPILRVQHVELKRGPIARLAGLASLQVFSAGGATHTFEIPGIEVEVAERLRQFILDHKDVSAK